MPIYTKTGDQGETGLLGKVRVSKASARIEAIGSVDELNATIGVIRSFLAERGASSERQAVSSSASQTAHYLLLTTYDQWLVELQSHLFAIGAELASPNGGHEDVNESDIVALEQQIDAWTAGLPELTRFILPGGSPIGAELHRARAVCRRAERALVALIAAEPDRPVRPALLKFMNRLSDALFTAARFANHLDKVVETPWQRKA